MFFLPFVDISCSGHKIATLSGIQLIKGTTIKIAGEEKSEKIKPEPLIIYAFICGIFGLGLSYLKSKGGAIASAISEGIGLTTLQK